MTARRRALVLVVAFALSPIVAFAQSTPTMIESYARARTIVDRAVAAHGGMDALRAARQVRVELSGHEYHRYQSRRAVGPLDSTVRTNDLMVDLARGRLVNEQTRGYPGGFYYTTRFVSDSARHWNVDVRNGTYSAQQWPAADQQFGNLFMLPQFLLLAAAEPASPGLRRYLGRVRLHGGAEVEAVTVPTTGGGLVTLGFDARTGHLRALLGVGYDPLLGDAAVETEFVGWRTLGGLLLPERTVSRRGGEVTAIMRFVAATASYAIPDSLLAPPPGFATVAAPPPEPRERELAPGVWAVRTGGSWTLVVAFADHALVVDAQPRGAAEIIQRVATLAPGKPIRWVVPTHHHDDHFMGVRQFAAAGATTVTTPDNVAFFRRAMSAPKSTVSNLQVDGVPAAKVEALANGRRLFTDGTRTVEIHDVGPNAHAEEMLVAWLPQEGILFHGDLVEVPATGLAMRGNNAEATTQLAAFIRRQGWQVRTFAGVHGFLASPAEFERLVRFPLVGPNGSFDARTASAP